MNTPQPEPQDLTTLYWFVGAMVVMNFGTILTVIGGVGRIIWFVAKLDSRVEKNSNDVSAAHVKIRALENGK